MKFSKMHGLGNDFLVLADDGSGRDYNAIAPKICARRTGVGADGIIIVLPSKTSDIRMRIVNADGSEAEMCGNGIRCFAKFVYENDILKKQEMQVETLAGIIKPKLNIENGIVESVRVDMGHPSFERQSIPMSGSGSSFDVPVDLGKISIDVSSMLMGVPHSIVLTDDIESFDTAFVGPAVENHKLFPRKTNVNFAQVIDKENIKVKTWERGVGFTLACGTGCCACVAGLYKKGLVTNKVNVHVAVGELVIEVLEDWTVLMTGPAELVYNAELK